MNLKFGDWLLQVPGTEAGLRSFLMQAAGTVLCLFIIFSMSAARQHELLAVAAFVALCCDALYGFAIYLVGRRPDPAHMALVNLEVVALRVVLCVWAMLEEPDWLVRNTSSHAPGDAGFSIHSVTPFWPFLLGWAHVALRRSTR